VPLPQVVTIRGVTQPVLDSGAVVATPTPAGTRLRRAASRPGTTDDDDAARRYARLLVSEIKLYHESAVTAGRRDRNLLERLRIAGDRPRQRLYGERVPAAVQSRTDYFDQELVGHLANGDASLLGRRDGAATTRVIALSCSRRWCTGADAGYGGLAAAAARPPSAAGRAGRGGSPQPRPTEHPRFPSALADYWLGAASRLDGRAHGSRVRARALAQAARLIDERSTRKR